MEPFIGQIQLFAFDFAPKGWALCDGRLLAINTAPALFSLIGTTYGGDGRVSFGLPDLRGRVPVHQGTGPGLSPRAMGERAGEEAVALTGPQVGPHSHLVAATAAADSKSPSGTVPGFDEAGASYGAPDGTTMDPAMIVPAQGGAPHDNMSPYLVLSYCIAIEGIFPSRP